MVVALVALLSMGLSGCHSIDTKTLPRMYQGLAVWMPLRSTGGAGPLTWSATGLPPGLSLEVSTGVLSGTPTTAGMYSLTVSAVDPASDDATATITYALEVSSPSPVDLVEPTWTSYFPYDGVISDDGRFVGYQSGDPQFRTDPDVPTFAFVVLDRTTGTRSVAFEDDAKYFSRYSISGDGRYLVFIDGPPDYVGPSRIGVWDRVTGSTEFIPDENGATSFSGAFSAVLSDDGQVVAYVVANGPSGHVFVYDRTDGTTAQVTRVPVLLEAAAISGDGSTVAFTTWTDDVVDGDVNARSDVFVWDRATGTTERITDNATGDPDSLGSIPSLSADGSSVAYSLHLGVPGAPHTFVWDRATGARTPVPHGGDFPQISSDGRRILSASSSATIPSGGEDLVVWDRSTGAVQRTPADSHSSDHFAFAGDGRHLVFGSGIFGPAMSVWELLD